MNDEDQIKLSRVGMIFGGFMAVAAAAFALGGEELLQLRWLTGSALMIAAIIITSIAVSNSRSEMNKLKKTT